MCRPSVSPPWRMLCFSSPISGRGAPARLSPIETNYKPCFCPGQDGRVRSRPPSVHYDGGVMGRYTSEERAYLAVSLSIIALGLLAALPMILWLVAPDPFS